MRLPVESLKCKFAFSTRALKPVTPGGCFEVLSGVVFIFDVSSKITGALFVCMHPFVNMFVSISLCL